MDRYASQPIKSDGQTTASRAAVIRETNGPFRIEPVALERPRDNEVRVKIVATGICHTDLLAVGQKLPFPLPAILGHEGAGVVEAVGAKVSSVVPGDHVVMTYCSCGTCESCFDAHSAYCDHKRMLNFKGYRLDGSRPISQSDGGNLNSCFFGQSSFAEHALVHERSLVKVPHDVPLELLGPLACGLMTGAGAVLNVLRPGPGQSLVVIGAGAVGCAAIMAAKLCGAGPIIAVDRNALRLEIALELGATHTIHSVDGDLAEKVRAIAGRGGTDFAIECVGSAATVRTAMECLRPRGKCIMAGAASGTGNIPVPASTLIYGRSLQGVVQGDSNPATFIPHLIDLWLAGRFPFDSLIDFYSFDDIERAVRDAKAGISIKPVLRMTS